MLIQTNQKKRAFLFQSKSILEFWQFPHRRMILLFETNSLLYFICTEPVLHEILKYTSKKDMVSLIYSCDPKMNSSIIDHLNPA